MPQQKPHSAWEAIIKIVIIAANVLLSLVGGMFLFASTNNVLQFGGGSRTHSLDVEPFILGALAVTVAVFSWSFLAQGRIRRALISPVFLAISSAILLFLLAQENNWW